MLLVAAMVASALAGLVSDTGRVLTYFVPSVALLAIARVDKCDACLVWIVPRLGVHRLVVNIALYHLV